MLELAYLIFDGSGAIGVLIDLLVLLIVLGVLIYVVRMLYGK
jgi:hypothetical protein